MQKIEEDAVTIKKLNDEINKLMEKNLELKEYKNTKKVAVKNQLNDIVQKAFDQIVKVKE